MHAAGASSDRWAGRHQLARGRLLGASMHSRTCGARESEGNGRHESTERSAVARHRYLFRLPLALSLRLCHSKITCLGLHPAGSWKIHALMIVIHHACTYVEPRGRVHLPACMPNRLGMRGCAAQVATRARPASWPARTTWCAWRRQPRSPYNVGHHWRQPWAQGPGTVWAGARGPRHARRAHVRAGRGHCCGSPCKPSTRHCGGPRGRAQQRHTPPQPRPPRARPWRASARCCPSQRWRVTHGRHVLTQNL